MEKNIDPFLLIVTMEECGELVQACSKVYRHGNTEEDRKLLSEEVGDVLAMMNLLCEEGLVDLDIVERKREAREKKHRKC
jgi:NTP pyrophosphatase (non-canonical NTP hydrolase)